MELVVAQVQRRVDWFERLEIDIDFAFLPFLGQDFTAVDDQAIGRDFVVKLEALLGRGNGGKDGLTVDARLDVRCGALACVRHSLLVTAGLSTHHRRIENVRILRPTSSPHERSGPSALSEFRQRNPMLRHTRVLLSD